MRSQRILLLGVLIVAVIGVGLVTGVGASDGIDTSGISLTAATQADQISVTLTSEDDIGSYTIEVINRDGTVIETIDESEAAPGEETSLSVAESGLYEVRLAELNGTEATFIRKAVLVDDAVPIVVYDVFPVGGQPDQIVLSSMMELTSFEISVRNATTGAEVAALNRSDFAGSMSDGLLVYQGSFPVEQAGSYYINLTAVNELKLHWPAYHTVGTVSGPEQIDWDGINATAADVGATTAVITVDDVPDGAVELIALSEGDQLPTEYEGDTLLVRGLQENTSYNVSVQAMAPDGRFTTDGPNVSFTTGILEFPDGADLTVEEFTDQSVTLSWPEAEPADEAMAYVITFSDRADSFGQFYIGNWGGNYSVNDGNLSVAGGILTYSTPDVLLPETEYTFNISVLNQFEQARDHLAANGTTATAEEPEWDDSVAVTNVTSDDTVVLNIDKDPIDFFDRLVVYDAAGNEVANKSQYGVEIDGLSSNTSYAFTLQAQDEFGQETDHGPTVEVRTDQLQGANYVDAYRVQSPTGVEIYWQGAAGTYEIYRNGSQIARIHTDGTGEFVTDNPARAETEYIYEVIRVLDNETSEPLNDSVVTGLYSATRKVSVEEDGSPADEAVSPELSGNGQYLVYEAIGASQIYRYDVETGTRERVSIDGPAETTFNDFAEPAINTDGSVVAFQSKAGNHSQIFVRDLANGTTELVSGAVDGGGVGNDTSEDPRISADGRYIAFRSAATNLVEESTTGYNIYVYDRETSELDLIPINQVSYTTFDLSPDGNYVALEAEGTHLADMHPDVPSAQTNVFLYNRSAEEFTWVSQPNEGGVPTAESADPVVSENGEYVAFVSDADNLTGGNEGSDDIYRYDASDGELERLMQAPSLSSNIDQPLDITPDGRYVVVDHYRVDTRRGITSDFGYNHTGDPWEFLDTWIEPDPRDLSISDDGSEVGFEGFAGFNTPNVVPNAEVGSDAYVTTLGDKSVWDPPTWPDDSMDVTDTNTANATIRWEAADSALFYYVYVNGEREQELPANTTEYTLTDLQHDSDYEVRIEAMHPRGVLSEDGPNATVTTETIDPPTLGVKAYDVGALVTWSELEEETIDHVDVHIEGDVGDVDEEEEQGWLLIAELQPDTAYEVKFEFGTEQDNIVWVNTSVETLERGAGISTELIARNASGQPLADDSRTPDMTPDGALTVYTANDPVIGNTSLSEEQVILRDTRDGSLELISRPDGTGIAPEADDDSWNPRISADGSLVYFLSEGKNLDESVQQGESDALSDQLVLRNRETDETRLISQSDGRMAIDGVEEFDISRDGSRAVFVSDAENLHADADGTTNQIYVYDLESDLITLVSAGDNGGIANEDAEGARISADGEYITFHSDADNLVSGVTNDVEDIYRYEVGAERLERVSFHEDGGQFEKDAVAPDINGDGSEIAFITESDAFGSDGGEAQIAIWAANEGVSHVPIWSTSFSEYTVDASELSFADDGRFVAFRSTDDIAVPRDPDATHIYVYDRATGYTMRGDVHSDGTPGDADTHDDFRLMNAEIPTLAYRSEASNLVDAVDDSIERTYKTELSRFDVIAEVDPPEWGTDAQLRSIALSQRSLQLDWDQAIHEIGVESYIVTSNALDSNVTVDGAQTSVVIDDLTPDTSYTFEVYAQDASGQRSAALSAEATTLSEDDLVVLDAESNGGIVELAWDPTTDEAVEGYLIQHRQPGGDWQDRLTVEDRMTATATDSGLAANTTYEYRVQALCDADETTGYSQTATVTTPSLVLDEAVWQLESGDRIDGHLTRSSNISVILIGDAGWNGSATVAFQRWDDPADAAPVEETSDLDLTATDDNPRRYETTFELPENTAAVTAIEANLTDGDAVSTKAVGELPISVFADLRLNTTWPADIEFPEHARLSIWSGETQDGATTSFDEERNYTFQAVTTDEDRRSDYRVRVRDRFTNQVLFEETVSIGAGLAHAATIDDPIKPASIFVEVVSPTGTPERGVQIRAEDAVTGRYLGSIYSDDGDGYQEIAQWRRTLAGEDVRLSIGGTSAEPYRLDTEYTVSLEPGRNNVTFLLEEWEEVTVEGVVSDEDGDPVAGAEISGFQQFENAPWAGFGYSNTTNENGEYMFSVKTGRELSLSSTYRPDRDAIGGSYEAAVAIGDTPIKHDIELDAERYYTIRPANITYEAADGSPITLERIGRSEADGLNFRIEGENISSWRAQRDGAYPFEGWLPVGEELEVSIDGHDLGIRGSAKTPVVTGPSRTIDVAIDFGTGGQVAGHVNGTLLTPDGTPWDTSDPTISGWTARLYERQDGEYTRIRTLSRSGDEVAFNLGGTGDYRLRITGKYRGVRQSASVEYTLASTGETVELGDLDMSSEGRFGFRAGNMMTGPSEPMMSGTQGTIRASYAQAGDGDVSDTAIAFDLPDNLSYVDDTLVHDGNATVDAAGVTYDGDTLEVALGTLAEDATGDLQFEVEAAPEAEADTLEIPASVHFDDGDERTEWMGSADVEVGATSIVVPNDVTEATVSVDGHAPGESTVEVFVDNERMTETTAAPNGRWRASIDLPADGRETFDVYARATTGAGHGERSPTRTITYDPGAPDLETVHFRQDDDPEVVDSLPNRATRNIPRFLPATSDWTSFTPDGSTRFPRTMLAGLPFEFEFEYDRPGDIDNLYVFVEGPAGGVAKAERDESTGLWEAYVETDRLAQWKLGRIYVATDLPADVRENISEGPMPTGKTKVDLEEFFAQSGTVIANPSWKIDPSGVVYEVEQNNTIEGVTATVFEYNVTTDEWEEWNGEWWGETNPQETDASGFYGWDVPAGDWRVVYEKDGYETTYSEDVYGDIEVPPPHFDVNIPMKSLEPPEVVDVNLSSTEDEVRLTFNRHVNITTVSEHTVFLRPSGGGDSVAATIAFPETVKNPHTNASNATLADEVHLRLDETLGPGEYDVVVTDLVESYAEVPMAEETIEPIEVDGPPAPVIDTVEDADGTVTFEYSLGAAIDTAASTVTVDGTDRNVSFGPDAMSVTVTSGGAVEVTLTLVDEYGRTATESITVGEDEDTPAETTTPSEDDDPAPPTGVIDASPGSGVVGSAIGFDASASTGDREIVAYEWDFGDETTATGAVVEHAYDAPGEYAVSLTVTDADGHTDTDTTTVSIAGEPAMALSASDVAFGPLGPGESATAEVSIANDGTAALTIASLDLSGPAADAYAIESGGFELTPGDERTVEIVVTATADADTAATLSIETNDADAGAGSVDLSYEPIPAFELTDVALGRTDVEPGEVVTVEATVTNVGAVAGEYTLALATADGTIVEETVTIAAGDEVAVALEEAFDAEGTYELFANGDSIGDVVVAAAAPDDDTPVDDGTDADDSDDPVTDGDNISPDGDDDGTDTIPGFGPVVAIVALLLAGWRLRD